ncbi:methyltransferase domain-containing protein [Sabulicella rubraurantiaca]|uniref:methyltransferase domain-containing protein n=1 Tax=Sabulicella rubraurantiaca TaxID=2811429 RepID=UPI001A978016|nr:methyltransferase domain-containing protein [Sabulicella rubraurantiaca]
MNTAMKLEPATLRGVPLTCPRDGEVLTGTGTLRCTKCGSAYPVVNGVPVLIDDERSVFAIADYSSPDAFRGASYGRADDRTIGIRRRVRRVARRVADVSSSLHYPSAEEAIAYVAALHERPRVLVIGSGGLRLGEDIAEVLNTDVAFADGVHAIADAHSLPFPDGRFDLVVAVAVLEHVADPQRVVAEMTRVLAKDGHVYAVTPFLQPVHMGAYDFTRFTPIGHRRLFRAYDEVAAGPALGVGSSLGLVLMATIGSAQSRLLRRLGRAFGLLVSATLRKLDRFLPDRGDAAAGCWFFGRKRDGAPISDRELVQSYRDGFGRGPMQLPTPAIAP